MHARKACSTGPLNTKREAALIVEPVTVSVFPPVASPVQRGCDWRSDCTAIQSH